MRDDVAINSMYEKQGLNLNPSLGCCEVHSRDLAGTTSEEECTTSTRGTV